MKESEELRLKSMREDNDFKSMKLANKSMRQARVERFDSKYLEILEKHGAIVTPFDGIKVSIDTQTDQYGIVDYFPKSNKLRIRKGNSWEPRGLKWIRTNITNGIEP